MAKIIIFIALVLLSQADYPEEDNVIVLTDANLQEAITTYPDILVEFYAPWCGHCKKLAPEYAKAAKTLKNRDPPIPIAKIDATENKESATKYGVTGFPNIKFFTNGTPAEYTGGRTEESIVNWMVRKTGPPTTKLESADDLQGKIDQNRLVAVLFTDKGSIAEKEFEAAAKQLDDIVFITFTNTDQFMQFDAQNPGLILYKQYDDRKNVYSGPFASKNLKDWIDDMSTPWVREFNEKTVQHVFKSGNPAVFFFRSNQNSEKLDEIENNLAADLKDKIAFAKADLSHQDNKKLGDHLGLNKNDQPLAIIVDTRDNGLKKFKLTDEINENNVKTLIENWEKGLIEPYMKSEELPAEPFDGNVRVLVGKNFEEVVFDKTKDVFVEFYAPWCGHCKKLAPDYEKVAEMFKDVDSVVVAKMDATANEAPGQAVKSYPTLKFFSAKNKRGKAYNGDRSFEGISEYIKANAAIKIKEEQIRTEL